MFPDSLPDFPSNGDKKQIDGWRARHEEERRRHSKDFMQARWMLRMLRFAMGDPDLCGELSAIVTRSTAGLVADEVFKKIWPEVAKRIQDAGILVQMRQVGSNFHVLSFSGDKPEFEERVRDWLLDLIGPALEEIFAMKKSRRK